MQVPYPPLIEIANNKTLETYQFLPIADRFGPLKRINLIVGPNNSGKSRLLRSCMYRKHDNDTIPYTDDTALCWKHFQEIPRLIGQLHESKSTTQIDPQISRIESDVPTWNIPINPTSRDKQSFGNAAGNVRIYGEDSQKNEVLSAYQGLNRILERLQHNRVPITRIYVPTLRTLRSQEGNDSLLEGLVRGTYFSSSDASPLIETGAAMYTELKKYLLGDHSRRSKIRRFEVFISENFMEGVEFSLIPREEDKQIFIRIGNEKEQSIAHLRDGLQHIITILFRPFITEGPTLLAIEEPELFLHPGFQTRLMDCFLKPEFDHAQVLATTHSNHLVNLTLDREQTAIFRIRKSVKADKEEVLPDFHVEPLSIEDREILQELGVRRSSLLLSNCVLFVEGPSDRRYYQRFLEIYAKETNSIQYLPDLHFSFLEYGGANLVQWGFVQREHSIRFERLVGDEILVIVDRDKSKSKQLMRQELEGVLGNRLICADVIEVENLLGPSVIRAVVQDYEGSEQDWLNGIQHSDYAMDRLGTFLESKILSSKRKSKDGHPYADVPSSSKGGGTIKNKTQFCDKALRHLERRTDMSEAAWKATETIYQFITRQNS